MTLLPPGRELDELIAEKITHWKCDERRCKNGWVVSCGACGQHGHSNCYGRAINGDTGQVTFRCDHCPSYSWEIAAAWAVVEKLTRYGFCLESGDDGTWGVNLMNFPYGGEIDVIADTAPLAICLAALKALSAMEGK